MYAIKHYYEARCITEYVLDQGYVFEPEKTMEIAYLARDMMSKYNFYEEEAIQKVMKELKIE